MSIHWIKPGIYEGNPALCEPREAVASDAFRPGDRVECIKAWHPRLPDRAGERGQDVGELFTVRAFLPNYGAYGYLVLEEHVEYLNAERFNLWMGLFV